MTSQAVTLIVEVAIDKGPFDTLIDDDWIDLSDRVQSFSMDRGRQDRTAEFEPGTISVVLDNSDNQLDPLVPGSLVELDATSVLWCPVRVRATLEGTTYPIFYGYTGPECWRVDRPRVGSASTSELHAVDTLGAFAWLDLPTSPFAAAIQWARPDWWIRGLGGDVAAGNGDSLQDSSGNGRASLIAASGSDVMFAASSLVPGDSDSALRPMAGVSGYTDDATLVDATTQFMMCCVWKGNPHGSDQEIIRQRVQPSGTIRWRVACNTSGSLVFTAYNTSGTPVAFTAAPANPNDAGGRWDDGQAHLIFVAFQGTSYMRIYADGQMGEQTSSVPSSVTGRVIFGGGAAVADIDEVAYWASSTTSTTLEPHLLAAFSGDGPFATDGLEDRLDVLWTLAGEPADPDDTGAPFQVHKGTSDPLLLGMEDLAGDLATAVADAASWFRGAAYVLRDGTVRVRTATALDNATHATHYATIRANLTDEPTPSSSPTVVRRSAPTWSGVRADRVINASRVTWSGLSFELRDDDSIATYGRHVNDWDSQVEDPLYAANLAAAEVANRADPTVELRTITIDPAIDPGAATFAVTLCELEAPVTITWTPPGESAQTTDVNVQGESWTWEAGTHWKVDLTLAKS